MLNGEDSSPDVRAHARQAPFTSVVVAWCGATKELESLLLQLATECEETGAELVLAHSATASQRRRLRRLFPGVRLALAPADAPLVLLRQLGAQTAIGDILVFVDSVTGVDARLKSPLPDLDGGAATIEELQREGAQLLGRADTLDTALG